MPVETPDRCAVQADLRSDPLWGTAFPSDTLLLVEQPGPWGRAGLLQSDFEPGVARRLIDALDRRGTRLLAIRRPGRDHHRTHRRWAYVDCRSDRESLVWGTYRHDAELLELLDDGFPWHLAGGRTDPEPLYLVCAHGTHDVCCAVRGRPVAAALEALRPGRVWECSHVGGDRFAANVLVAPSGLLYGSISEDLGEELVRTVDEGRALPAHLRGRVGWPPEAQAALAGLLTAEPGLSFRVVRFSAAEVGEDGPTDVELDVDGTRRIVRVQVARSDPQQLTCQAGRLASVRTYRPHLVDA